MRRAKPSHPLLDRERVWLLVLAGVTFALAFALWSFGSAQGLPWRSRPLKLWMLDVGQGDAFLIEFPTGEQLLVDGGPDDSVLSTLGGVLPPWDRTLDAILLTHPDADHVTGLISVLDRYRVGTVYESGVGARTPPASAFVQALAQYGARRRLVSLGDKITFGNATLTVLWPDEILDGQYPETRNNFSVNVLLEYGGTTVLLTGDAQEDAERVVGPRAGDIDVLKVGHHGSLTSTSYDFLVQTKPDIALISMGRDNPYGHPHPVIVRRLKEAGVEIFRTDQDGDVLLTSYGGEPIVVSRPLPF